MRLAAAAFSNEKASVEQIVKRVGYSSETTFSKVSKRLYNVLSSASRRIQNKI